MEDCDWMKSGEFRTTIQISLNCKQFGEMLEYLNRNKLNPKLLHSKWVPDGTPENEGYYEITSPKTVL